MYNTWPDLKFELLKEPCIGIDGVTVAFLVRATSSRKSRRKITGPTAQWEFASFYTVDLEQEGSGSQLIRSLSVLTFL